MLTSMAVPAIWTPLKTKQFTADCLTASEFVCTTKQLGRSYVAGNRVVHIL